MAAIQFDFKPNILTIKLVSSNIETIYEGKYQVKRLEDETLEYDLSNKSLVETLKQMQQDLSDKLKIYYPSGQVETFDQAVKSMINGLGSSVAPNVLEDIGVKKAYAKYYYEMFKEKIIKIDENSDALILSNLISYYFIKRLVHVFVMCTIYQKVSVPITSTTGNVLSRTPIVINNNEQSNVFTAERNALQAKILELEAAKKTTENTSTDSLDNMKKINTLNTALLNKAEEEIESLKNQVNSYRELLLQSTTMIFKLDELPNVILGSR